MNILTASVTITTSRLEKTRNFYEKHFGAKPFFDCGWYVVLHLSEGDNSPEICLMEPRDGTGEFAGGITLNLRVPNADDLHSRLIKTGLEAVIPLEDHPWGDRGFGLLDPSGLLVYCYHDIEPSSEFKPYFLAQSPEAR